MSTILNNLANSLGSLSTLSAHLSDLGGFLQGNELSSSRFDRIYETLKLFIKEPLVGVFGCMTDVESYNIILESHAGNFAMLAQIGIVGFGFYMFYFLCDCSNIQYCFFPLPSA